MICARKPPAEPPGTERFVVVSAPPPSRVVYATVNVATPGL